MTPDRDVYLGLERAGRFRVLAEAALADRPLASAECRTILDATDGEVASVLWAAFAVRARHFGRRVKLCVLNNARSGLCPEDCGYCSPAAVCPGHSSREPLN